jgi:hypothetical protein
METPFAWMIVYSVLLADHQCVKARKNVPGAFSGVGHKDVSTMIYTHVLNRGGRGVNSPADRL